MSCVSRIGGDQLDADALLRSTDQHAHRVDRKGTPGRLLSRGAFERSAVHFHLSEAAFANLATQIADAIAYLTANAVPLERLKRWTSLSTRNTCPQVSCDARASLALVSSSLSIRQVGTATLANRARSREAITRRDWTPDR
jgi:hypothetical protein